MQIICMHWWFCNILSFIFLENVPKNHMLLWKSEISIACLSWVLNKKFIFKTYQIYHTWLCCQLVCQFWREYKRLISGTITAIITIPISCNIMLIKYSSRQVSGAISWRESNRSFLTQGQPNRCSRIWPQILSPYELQSKANTVASRHLR